MKGIEIKLLRIQKGIKQGQIAKDTGINNTYLSLLEQDKMEEKKYSPEFVRNLKETVLRYLNSK